jgi:hypothetical protein
VQSQCTSALLVVGVRWAENKSLGPKFFEMMQSDEVIDEIMMQIGQVIEGDIFYRGPFNSS